VVKVTSAGPADVNSFDLISHLPSITTIKAKHSAERDDLEILYQTVRNIRETKKNIFETHFEKYRAIILTIGCLQVEELTRTT
jgi:hypothetical protein